MWNRFGCRPEVFISAESWIQILGEWKGHNHPITVSMLSNLNTGVAAKFTTINELDVFPAWEKLSGNICTSCE